VLFAGTPSVTPPVEEEPLPYSTQIDPPPIVMLSGAELPVGAVAKTIGVLVSMVISGSYVGVDLALEFNISSTRPAEPAAARSSE